MTAVSVTQPAGDLAARQVALVAALVAGGELPSGFDHARLSAARHALLVKRAQEVARAWPLLAASFGDEWTARFTAWAAVRPRRARCATGGASGAASYAGFAGGARECETVRVGAPSVVSGNSRRRAVRRAGVLVDEYVMAR